MALGAVGRHWSRRGGCLAYGGGLHRQIGRLAMKRRANIIRADKPLPGAWLSVLTVLLEEGTLRTVDLQGACKHYAPLTISGVVSQMHQHGLVQHAPGKQWGLSQRGIEAALAREQRVNAGLTAEKHTAPAKKIERSGANARAEKKAEEQHMRALRFRMSYQ